LRLVFHHYQSVLIIAVYLYKQILLNLFQSIPDEKLKIFFYFILLLCTSDGDTQVLPFHHYTMRDGLVSDNIRAVCQDSSGYIWIATGEGLSVFNSKNFQNYTSSDGLITDDIACLLPDRFIKNKIWIGTNDKGITVINNGRFEKAVFNPGGDKAHINTIFQSRDSMVFCGTGDGLFFIKNNEVKIPDYSTKTGQVYSFVERDNEIWAGTQRGLYVIPEGYEDIRIISLPGNPKQISSLLLDDKNNIWAFSPDTRVIYEISKNNEIKVFKINVRFFSSAMIEDRVHNIWLSTNNGLYKFNINNVENSLTRFTTASGLLQNNVTSILYDRENILWAATNDDGLSKLACPDLYRFKDVNKNSGNWSTVASDAYNHFWASAHNILVEFFKDDHGSWEKQYHPLMGEFRHENIHQIFCDSSDKLYVCSASGEIQVYKIILTGNSASILKKIEIVNLKNISEGDKLFTTFIDAMGEIWCSILDTGIILLDNKNHEKIREIYNVKDGIPDNSVRYIYQDSKDNLWFGGYNHGLSEFSFSKANSEKRLKFVRLFTTSDGLPDNDIRAITEKDSSLIIGTRYGGLAVLRAGKLRSIAREEGLFSNAVWSIAKTPSRIWLGTQAGVQSLQRDLNISWELSDEIPREPFYALTSSANGDLCFASANDYYIYEPSNTSAEDYHPPVYLNHFIVNGHERKVIENTVLPSDENTITFGFQGIINRNETEVRYEYRLINKNDSWKLSTNNNAVTYSMLDPGTYTFQVEAVDYNNTKSSTPAEITFRIDSPFYHRWWFYALILILITLLSYLFIRVRTSRLIEIEKIRTRIASDLHDEIGSGLTHIAMLSEHSIRETGEGQRTDAPDDKFSSVRSMERIGKISRHLVDSMIDVIWAIDPKFDSLNDFILNFKAYANEICESKNIELKVNAQNIEKIKVTAGIKRNLQLISKEALNNALKYSGCTEISYNLSVRSRTIYLAVEDNGRGFNQAGISYGHGIINMQKNVKDLNGSFEIKSEPDKGTGIYINFPVSS